jgi:hypothetical protein
MGDHLMSYDPTTIVEGELRVILSDQKIAGSAALFAAVAVASGVYDYIELTIFGRSELNGQGDVLICTYNGDTTDANYNWNLHNVGQAGGTHGAGGGDNRFCGRVSGSAGSNAADAFSPNRGIMQGISNSTVWTTMMSSNIQMRVASSSDNYLEEWGSVWESKSNVTTFTIANTSGENFVVGSTLRAVGVKKVNLIHSV